MARSNDFLDLLTRHAANEGPLLPRTADTLQELARGVAGVLSRVADPSGREAILTQFCSVVLTSVKEAEGVTGGSANGSQPAARGPTPVPAAGPVPIHLTPEELERARQQVNE